jgi:hypothetical protein
MTRPALTDLPFWPRLLSREEAARYVGASIETFDREVIAGVWPAPLRRGPHGGRATWDRLALDRAADRASGIAESPAPAPGAAPPVAPKVAEAGILAETYGYGAQGRRRSR